MSLLASPETLDQLADNGEQFARIGFVNDSAHVLPHTIGDVVGYTREENDWEFWVGSANCLGYKIAVHAWHFVIQPDQIHRVLKQRTQPLVSGRGSPKQRHQAEARLPGQSPR